MRKLSWVLFITAFLVSFVAPFAPVVTVFIVLGLAIVSSILFDA